jgi:hypothetical protein
MSIVPILRAFTCEKIRFVVEFDRLFRFFAGAMARHSDKPA